MTSVPTRDAWGERLGRRLGLWSAVAVLIGSTIGSGIFRVPALVAGEIGSAVPVLVLWAIGGAVALAGALTLAELAAALPRSGGIFAFILEAFGPLPAFLFGWSEMVVLRAAALGAIATIFAEYLGYFLPFTPMQVRYVAAGAVIICGAFNYVGVNVAAVVNNIATGLKFAALAALALLAFVAGEGSAAHFTVAPVGPVAGLSVMATALVAVMWTYDGWADLAFMGGEVRDPARNLPRALLIGTGLIVLVYALINVAYIYLVPVSEMGGSKLIAADAARHIPLLGAGGAGVIAAMVVVSCFGALNGSMMTGPRVFFAMADRGLFFRGIARVSPRFQSPSVAIWLATVLGTVYVLLNDFKQLADKFILGIWPFYALAVAAVFVFRRSRPDLERPYRAWGYPVVPALFLVASVGMVVNALWTDPINTGITFGIIGVGVPAFFVWRRFGVVSATEGSRSDGAA